MTRDQKITEAKKLQNEYLHLRANGQKAQSLQVEREYLIIRKELIDEVTSTVTTKKSLTMAQIKERVAKRPKPQRRETGIRSLDMELISQDKYGHGYTGGFTLGNFIQIAGVRGSGKSTIMMRIMAGLSNYEKVSWCDFEMGDTKAIETLMEFSHNDQNLNYYEGSREISDIIDEIKFLYTDGVRHFVIDSMMKINAQGYKRGYESFSYISSLFAELTSSLGINIYLINQMSQESQRNNQLMMKHGNDAEYDADYILFVLKKPTDETDEAGQTVYDENCRIVSCTKNRVDHRTFTVEIPKSEIFGIKPIEILYEEESA